MNRLATSQGFPFDDFDLNDVMLPEGEGDFGYASDDDAIDEEEIVTETGFGSVIGARQAPAAAPCRPRSAQMHLVFSLLCVTDAFHQHWRVAGL